MDETQSLILAAVKAGKTITQAAEEAGVPLGTVRRWLTEGRRKPNGPYGAFARAVDAARLSVPLPESGDRLAEIEVLAETVDGDPASVARLGLARSYARKIDWCEATPTGAAAMALANIGKQYQAVLDELRPATNADMQLLADALRGGEHEYHFEEALRRIAGGDPCPAQEDAMATLARVEEWRRAPKEGGIYADPGNFESLDQ